MKKTVLFTIPLLSLGLIGSSAVHAATDGSNPDPANRETPVTATLTIEGTNPMPPDPDTNGPKPTDPSIPNPSPKGPFGISYVPIEFSTEATSLNDSGEQTVDFKPNKDGDSFHVGVKDKTRDKKGWNLTASLNWDTAPIGSSIKFNNQTGSTPDAEPIKNNVGNDSAAKLESLTVQNGAGQISSGATDGVISISTDGTASNIMSAKTLTSATASYHGVYDYKIGKASLFIPETSKVKAGTYTGGKVDWNLALVP